MIMRNTPSQLIRPLGASFHRKEADRSMAGFSLLEVLVSVMIITVLMAAVFQFLRFNQQRYRGDQLLAERNQGARSALELMTQELQQAGHNPNFPTHKTLTAAATPTGTLV